MILGLKFDYAFIYCTYYAGKKRLTKLVYGYMIPTLSGLNYCGILIIVGSMTNIFYGLIS